MICNPFTHETLHLSDTSEGPVLVGDESATTFRVRDGIPILMNSANITNASQKSRRYYDAVAPIYAFTQSVYYRLNGGEAESRQEYLNYVRVKKGDRVLEVSVGNGANIRFLPKEAEYFGIDVSWKQLVRCKSTGACFGFEVELFQADAEHLPFVDNSFDVVFNVGSVNYFEDKSTAVDEMFRVAKPGALMVIADETEKAASSHNKLPIFRGYYNSWKTPVEPPVDELPSDAKNVRLTESRSGMYFSLQFTK